jgi:deoxyribonuclease-4
VDRHEHIGKGKIGGEAFCMVMNDERLRAIPKVIETPKGKDGELDWDNLETLLGCVEEEE